jgi:hypothetical protein
VRRRAPPRLLGRGSGSRTAGTGNRRAGRDVRSSFSRRSRDALKTPPTTIDCSVIRLRHRRWAAGSRSHEAATRHVRSSHLGSEPRLHPDREGYRQGRSQAFPSPRLGYLEAAMQRSEPAGGFACNQRPPACQLAHQRGPGCRYRETLTDESLSTNHIPDRSGSPSSELVNSPRRH